LKVIQFKEEAVRLNVTIEEVSGIIEKALGEGKIFGVVVPKKAEFIRFELDEVEALASELDFGKVSLDSLAAELKITVVQVRSVLQYLLNMNKISGILTYSVWGLRP